MQDPSDKAVRTLSEFTKFEQRVDELSAGDVGNGTNLKTTRVINQSDD